MTARVLVDSNVIFDVAQDGSPWHAWSAAQLTEAADAGGVCINQIIYAELAGYIDRDDLLDELVEEMLLERAHLPWEAASVAGRAFVQYRRRGGSKTSPLPDFYIGARAQAARLRLLTRDTARYRTYFPRVTLIEPNTAS